uniref:Uncharacterized protein MANES_09G130100 n=1 Tax=Rhizophora mucronata TaxID=61149 RepID=A0A2P2JWN3_RHIMU
MSVDVRREPRNRRRGCRRLLLLSLFLQMLK